MRGVALGLLSGLGACGGEAVTALPAFASELPGRTAIVLWSQDETPPPALVGLLDGIASWAGLAPVRDAGSDVLAWTVPQTVAVGWESLAQSRPFCDAMRALDTVAPHALFVDLHLLLAVAVQGADRSFLRQQTEHAMVFEGFRYIAAGVWERDGEWEAVGELGTTGVGAGLPGLLTAVVPQSVGPVLEDPDADVQFAAQFDPAIARRMLLDLADLSAVSPAIGNALRGVVGSVLNRALPHLGSWVSMRRSADSYELAVSLRDRAGLGELEVVWLPMIARLLEGRGAVDSGYRLEEDRAVLSSGAEMPPAERGAATQDPQTFVKVELPRAVGGVRVVGSLRRRAANSVSISVRLRL